MSQGPITGDVAGAVARFWFNGAGPSHANISRVLVENGYSDDYVKPPLGVMGPNKQDRVLAAFALARREPARSRGLVDGLLGLLRNDGLIGRGDSSEDEQRLRLALGRASWYLTDDGQLRASAGIDLTTGGRAALEEQLDRLRRSTGDPALLLGTAKELLESVAKFVLEEHGYEGLDRMDFGQLWYLARERLGIKPEQVDPNLPGAKQIKRIHGSTWTIAENVNEIRNLQGTGHGHTLPAGISSELAMLVVREACTVAEYLLALLEKSHGRSA